MNWSNLETGHKTMKEVKVDDKGTLFLLYGLVGIFLKKAGEVCEL